MLPGNSEEIFTNPATSVFLKRGPPTTGVSQLPRQLVENTYCYITFQVSGNKITRSGTEKVFQQAAQEILMCPKAGGRWSWDKGP